MPKSTEKCFCLKAGFHSIGATIHTCRDGVSSMRDFNFGIFPSKHLLHVSTKSLKTELSSEGEIDGGRRWSHRGRTVTPFKSFTQE